MRPPPAGCSFRQMPPSRQERRKAERDAAKRAPAQAGAAGANTARANAIGHPLGDWTSQTEDPGALLTALGIQTVKQRAAQGDREAQWSMGFGLVNAADGAAGATTVGAAGRSPRADVGFVVFVLCTKRIRSLTTLRRVDVTIT